MPRQTVLDQVGNYAQPQAKLTYGQAFWRYLKDANKFHLFGLSRVFLLFLVGYAPFAALNDALVPFTFGLAGLDDFEIPIAILAAFKILIDVSLYRNPGYKAKR
ncbi:hypothetical protein HJC99_03945 [Candidatus Saccharibacteria bacterium]|nr:hypothetical protein [Candidatus Saccharibacteria bacterium]